VIILSSMRQIIAARYTITSGNHLRRKFLVATPSHALTVIADPITTSSAIILWARVNTALAYAIKTLSTASLAIEKQAMIRTLTTDRVYALKYPRRLNLILKGVHLCRITVKNIRVVV